MKQIRGLVVPHQDECKRTARLCRRYGIKWLMAVTTDGRLSPREARQRVRQIADDYADVVLGIEGINEPDTNRSGWAQHTVDIQRAIWEVTNNSRALKGVKVVSPSLHDRNEDVSDGAGYRALKRKGIREFCDVAGLHSYPKGRRITFGLADRLKLVDIAYRGKPVWISEFGVDQLLRRRRPEPDFGGEGRQAGRSGDPEDRRPPTGAEGVPLRAGRRPSPRRTCRPWRSLRPGPRGLDAQARVPRRAPGPPRSLITETGGGSRVGVEPTSLVLIQSQAGPTGRPTGDREPRLGPAGRGSTHARQTNRG